MKYVTLSLLFFLSSCTLFAQDEASQPILLDRSVLSGVGLESIEFPEEPEREFFQRQLYRGAAISVYVVSSGNWINQMDNFPFDEFVYMLHGEAIIRPSFGASQTFHSRDFIFAHRGFTGDWEIHGGEHFHYELSVISSSRADAQLAAEDLRHSKLSAASLSGLEIDLNETGSFEQTLAEGVELTVKLMGEAPRTINLRDTPEQLIYLLSGQISIQGQSGNTQEFYSGDFFILPQDCEGIWTSAGHGLIKYLSVNRTT
ncbi:MAG: cupin domain-containing protein [Bacteroidota bacterium]